MRGQRAKLTPSIPLDSYKRALNAGQNNPWIMQGWTGGGEGESRVLPFFFLGHPGNEMYISEIEMLEAQIALIKFKSQSLGDM